MEKFRVEMEKLKKDLDELLMDLDKIMSITLDALVKLDVSGIERVRDLDLSLYHKIMDIESKCVNLVLLYSPVASDLRKIITMLKMLVDIDRIGRYSYDISLLIPKFVEKGHLGKPEIIPKMVEHTRIMVGNAIKSFLDEDLELAGRLQKDDDVIDELFNKLETVILEYMKENSENLQRGVYYMLIGKYLERMADHAVNIGNNVIYMISGKRNIKI